MENFTTILSFDSLPLAHIARSRLESEGIPCILRNENIVAIDWLYANAVGGVTLQVPTSLAEEALTLLAEGYNPSPTDIEDPELTADTLDGLTEPTLRCPRCSSEDITLRSPNRLFMLIKIPFKVSRRFCFCEQCHHYWSIKI